MNFGGIVPCLTENASSGVGLIRAIESLPREVYFGELLYWEQIRFSAVGLPELFEGRSHSAVEGTPYEDTSERQDSSLFCFRPDWR